VYRIEQVSNLWNKILIRILVCSFGWICYIEISRCKCLYAGARQVVRTLAGSTNKGGNVIDSCSFNSSDYAQDRSKVGRDLLILLSRECELVLLQRNLLRRCSLPVNKIKKKMLVFEDREFPDAIVITWAAVAITNVFILAAASHDVNASSIEAGCHLMVLIT